MQWFVLFLLCLVGLYAAQKICIIGSGIGGTATAKFLKDMNASIEIHVFEKSDRVGGRLLTIELGDPPKTINAGGSIIHKDNYYIREFAKELNLEVLSPSSETSAIYDGKSFLFESSGIEAVDMGKMAWRYGRDLITMNNVIKDVKTSFEKIYTNQAAGIAYRSPADLFMDVGLYDWTKISLAEAMLQHKIKPKLINEIMTAVTRVNYGQNASISGLAGVVGLLGVGNELRIVKDGFQQICAKLLHLKATKVHLNSEVKEIVKTGHGTNLKFASGEESCNAVVIAAPLEQSQLKIPGLTTPISHRTFQLTQTTFIKGTLRPSFFGKKANLPDAIYTIEGPGLKFNSIGRHSQHQGKKAIYKIFSREVLSSEFLNQLFENPEILKAIPWRAYPSYTPPEHFTPFDLGTNLVYLNTIESGASAMEMSAIAGRNAALLLDQWLDLDQRKKKMPDEEQQIEL